MISFLYEHCYTLGRAFGFGAFEGLILYISVIALGVTTVTNAKKEIKK